MTPRELAIAKAFRNVSFSPATAAKRFARHMAEIAEHSPDYPLTEKQAKYMAKVAYRYRRQLPPHLGYPLVDDGSEAAAQGHEAPEPKPVERPLSARDQKRAETAARRAAKAEASKIDTPELPL